AKTWATKCCPGTYKNNYQLCCGIKVILKSGNKTIEIANIDIKKQYTIFYGEFRYCLILHFDKKTTSFFLPNDCFKWFLAGNNDKITCIHDGKAAFILFSECL
ncbi:hypothetical protein, partial [Phocaeicola vulgatus]|uniref:hypothetical protein n=1 Tax=Phocaeicola vulgatus TaxID=821 RepID=UPI00356927C2